jgi:hypothetical protein
MGYHGQLIKQSRITVRGRQSIDLNLASRPKHTVGCPRKDNFPRLFPKVLGLGAKPTVLGARLAGIPRKVSSLTQYTPLPGS